MDTNLRPSTRSDGSLRHATRAGCAILLFAVIAGAAATAPVTTDVSAVGPGVGGQSVAPRQDPLGPVTDRRSPQRVTTPVSPHARSASVGAGARVLSSWDIASRTPATHSENLYDPTAVRYQDPDKTACTAASTLMMLNLIDLEGAGGPDWRWTRTLDRAVQDAILSFEHDNDTLSPSGKGSDAHGWRNALNQMGWGDEAMRDRRYYDDLSFASFDDAVRAAVRSIARTHKPVGISGWAGGHAQILHGYEVTGEDPATSDAFDVRFVYLTDPLKKDGLRDARISAEDLRSGPMTYRFRPYAWKDSPFDDPYTPGTRTSWREWYGRWVIVAAVR